MQGKVALREIGFKGLQTYKEALPKEGDKCSCQSNCRNDYTKLLGKDPATKSDNFLEKFKTSFAPPPSFLENYVANFFKMDMVAFVLGGIGQIVSVNINTIVEKTYPEP